MSAAPALAGVRVGRPPAGTVLALAGAAVVALTVAVAVHPAPFGLDSGALRTAGRLTALQPLARLLTHLGTWYVTGPLLVVVGLLRRAPRRRWLAAAALLVVGTAGREVLVHAIGRARPPAALWAAPAGGASFPSGHTTAATLAAGVLVLLWCGSRRGPAVVGAALALVVGLTRVVLRVHWATDVLGGWAYGLVCVAVAVLVVDRLDRRTRARTTDLS